MNEYISREAAVAKITFLCELREIVCNPDDEFLRGLKNALNTIKSNELIPAADVQPVSRWISTKERLPEIGQNVLIYYSPWYGDAIQVAKLTCDKIMFDICGEFNVGVGLVTHWMPLPELPKE